METSDHGITAQSAVYKIGGRRFKVGSRGFADSIADAYAAHQRPRCMCVAEGVEMYVARLAGPNGGYIVKRMPDTGSLHEPDCPSYEPPAEFSGLGQVLGSAITEDPATGETTLTLDFALTKMPGRSQAPPAGGDSDSAATDGTRLSLRGLLHYLWDQAELTRWHPGFAGKRTWATVRRHLLQATEHKLAQGYPLRARLYVPEHFTIDERDAINTRRLAQWQHVVAAPGNPQHLMLLIGEVKQIAPARYGFKVIVKHLPDQAFMIEEQLFRRLRRRFGSQLELWGASDDIHMVMIATFGVGRPGVPEIHELCLMPVTRQWLPVEDGYEKLLVERLVIEGRSFVKGLRYNLGGAYALANATLTDCEAVAMLMFVVPAAGQDGGQNLAIDNASTPIWMWHPSNESMPPLPTRRRLRGADGRGKVDSQ